MTEIRELRNEHTLSSIAHDPENKNHALLFGIIIDISEPYKIEESTNFTTKLKIIDPSFNYKADLKIPDLKFHKFVHINIYSETPEQAPRIQYVGDIIRLRRFKFKMTPKNELMGNMQKYSNWLIYSGKRGDSFVSECYKTYNKNKDRQLTNYERGRLMDLREWNDSFFFQNSLKYITWWTNSKGVPSCQKVDLILKCVGIDMKSKTLKFIDEEKNNYSLQLKAKPNKIENEVIKLRCVNVENRDGDKPRVIKLTELSSCLLIPNYFYDARRFEKMLSGVKSVSKNNLNLENKFPFLKGFTLIDEGKNQKWVSAVKKSLGPKETLSVKALKDIYDTNKQYNEKFIVEGYIMGLVSTKPTDVIKKLNLDTMEVTDLKSKENKDHKYRIIFNLVLTIRDDSMKKNDYLTVYLTTEGGDMRLFDAWELLPNSDNLEEWAKVKNKQLKDFEKKLNSLKNLGNKVNLGLQFLKTKTNKPFLKVVDTVFLPL